MGWGVAWLLVLLPLAWFRWRRWARVDETGVTLMRPRGRVRAELRWEDVEAFAQSGANGVELHGRGILLRLGEEVERVGEVWLRVLRECEGRILDGLRNRLQRGESTLLRFPASRFRAHAAYLGITLLLVAQAATYGWLWYASREKIAFVSLIHIAVWSWLLLLWRRDIAWLGGWIRVEPQGLILKKLDATWNVPWEDVVRLAASSSDGWKLERKSGRPLRVHAGLLNLLPLGRLVGERTGIS